jgi:hypothetical protein
MRGMLTSSIQEKSQYFLHRPISQKELRLYPYIDYCIKNNCQGWGYNKLDMDEMNILTQLYEEHHIVYSPERIMVTRD